MIIRPALLFVIYISYEGLTKDRDKTIYGILEREAGDLMAEYEAIKQWSLREASDLYGAKKVVIGGQTYTWEILEG